MDRIPFPIQGKIALTRQWFTQKTFENTQVFTNHEGIQNLSSHSYIPIFFYKESKESIIHGSPSSNAFNPSLSQNRDTLQPIKNQARIQHSCSITQLDK